MLFTGGGTDDERGLWASPVRPKRYSSSFNPNYARANGDIASSDIASRDGADSSPG